MISTNSGHFNNTIHSQCLHCQRRWRIASPPCWSPSWAGILQANGIAGSSKQSPVQCCHPSDFHFSEILKVGSATKSCLGSPHPKLDGEITTKATPTALAPNWSAVPGNDFYYADGQCQEGGYEHDMYYSIECIDSKRS